MLNVMNPFAGANPFIPHGHCYLWKPELVGLHILSDALITLAYYSIPLTLFYFVRRRQDLPFTWLFLLFSAFIVACGTTHLLEIWTLWHPTYWLSGSIKLLTAGISVTTAILLVPIVPKALALPSPKALELANRTLQQEVAERKQAELALSRLAAIVESSGDAIISKALDGTITSWNAGAEKLFGYTAAEMIGHPITLLMPPNSTDELPYILEHLKHGEMIERYETVRIHKNGQRLDIAATISPIKDSAGQVIGASKIARDISQQKQAELALRESENRFQAFMDNSPSASWITDGDGQMLYHSQTYARLFQIPDKIVGKTIFEIYPPSIADAFYRTTQQVAETGETIAMIEVAPRPDGTLGKFLVYKFPMVEYSGQRVVGGAAIDITEREQAKEDLRSLNDRLQYLLTNAPVAIFSCKAEGDYGATSISDNIRAILGYEPQTFLADSSFWITHIHADDRDRVLSEAAQIFANDTHTHEYRFLHADGEYHWLYEQLQLVRDETGKPTEMIGYLVDISDRKRAEQSLQEREAFLRAIGDNIANGYLFQLIRELDGRYRYTYVSAGVERVSGLKPDDILADSSLMFKLVVEEDLPYMLQKGEESAQNLSVFDVQVRERLANGESRWLRLCSTPRRLEDGRVVWDGIRLDIDNLKQIEAALRQSEAKNQAMLAAIPDLLLRLKRDGTCLAFIPPTSPESGTFLPVKQHISEILPGDLLQHQLQRIEQALATGQLQVWEHQLIKKGELHDEEVRLVPCGDDEVLLIIRDVNDRKRTEEALQQSEARNRALIQAIPDLLIRIRQDGTYLDIQQTETIRILNPSQMFVGNNIHAILPAEIAQTRMEYVQRALQTRELQVYEYQLNIDGDLQFEEVRIVPCAEDEVLFIVRDISDRKRAEESLRRYERIVSATTDAISLIDRNYVYQVVNQSYLDWYNKPQDEIVGHPVSEFLPVDVYETTIKPRLDQCMTGQVVQYEMWADYTTLGAQFLSVTYDPYYDTDRTVIGVVVSLRNITRLKQAEVELELQSLIARNMAEGVCMVKVRDGRFVYANPKFERMFGYDADELIGQHVSIVNYEDRNTNTTKFYETLAKAILEKGEAGYEVHNVKKDGTSFWCQATTSVFEHPNYGAVFVVVQQDITERKQAEALIQASLTEKEVLLKEIHHRVKNNLGIVDGLLHMQLRRSADPDVVAALQESQNRIASIALVHEKLYGSKDLANIDFAQYIADLTAHLFDSYNTYANQVKLTMQIEPIALDIDTAVPCGLIINELVSNALKYAFPNAQAGEIQVKFQQHNYTITFSVSDNGMGLPPHFSLKQTKTLGITLVTGLVKQLKGTLEVNAQAGTTFIISFRNPKP